MRDRLTITDWLLLPVLAAIGLGALYAAFRFAGFLGIGILGALVGIVAVNVDLQQGVPNASLFGMVTPTRERESRADTAAWRADLDRSRLPIFIAKVVSAGLVILGFGLFFTVQLPG